MKLQIRDEKPKKKEQPVDVWLEKKNSGNIGVMVGRGNKKALICWVMLDGRLGLGTCSALENLGFRLTVKNGLSEIETY